MSMQALLAILRRFPKPSNGFLPRVCLLTDADRGFDLPRQLHSAPKNAMVIERTFGAQPILRRRFDRQDQPQRFATCSPRQARLAGLDGLHWPEKRLRFRLRSHVGALSETASAHRGLAIAKALQAGIVHVMVSTAFKSASPSATRPLNSHRLAQLQRSFPKAALYALGGVTPSTARRLMHTGVHGIALVSLNGKKPTSGR